MEEDNGALEAQKNEEHNVVGGNTQLGIIMRVRSADMPRLGLTISNNIIIVLAISSDTYLCQRLGSGN